MLSRRHEVALLHPDLDRVLAVDGKRGGATLPVVPDEWPDHRDLVAATGDPGAVLAAPAERRADGTVTNVLRGSSAGIGRVGARWVAVDDLDHAGAAVAVRRAVTAVAEGARGAGWPDWFGAGWRPAVDDWVAGNCADLGLTPTGPAEITKMWGLSAVLRRPVTGPRGPADVWFKATCARFHDEPAITAVLHELVPDLVPGLLGIDTDRAWMLMEPVVGIDDEQPGTPAAVARALARVQRETLAGLAALQAAGAPDRGAASTIEELRTVLHDSVELPLMTAQQRGAARELEPWLMESVQLLAGSGLPDTLSHGDLHLGNAGTGSGGPVIFDWTDACLAHPLLDVRHLAASAAAGAPAGGGEAAAAAVRAAHAELWRPDFPQIDDDRYWEAAGVVELVFTAISYEHIQRAQPEVSRWELGGVIVDILDRLIRLHAARG
ncbi:phosphotransferase [Nakamurella sp. YIM 132087]|uniref:Phosphotransferase n=1 Tax=Nakamurella alba TaxID=2665158 RepID=A0A7K1FME1_9ACTN|nr:phosphotransferase [Nakamurella alba]MTD14403.1 phosphotransferase [Nakamurella alba]